LAAVALSIGASTALVAEFGTAAEAKALLERAVTARKASSADADVKFSESDGEFRDRDLHVYCFDSTTGEFTAHVDSSLLGTDIRTIKEKDGSPLGQKIFDAAQKERTISTVRFKFPKPGGTEPVPKETYVTRVGHESCGVSYYKFPQGSS